MTLPESPLRIALFEPRIPPNTGNIARSCAAFQLPLSLIEPLGFSIDDRAVKRADWITGPMSTWRLTQILSTSLLNCPSLIA